MSLENCISFIFCAQNFCVKNYTHVQYRRYLTMTEQEITSEQLEVLEYFNYAHLPTNLQEISKPFGELAYNFYKKLPDSEQKMIGLQKLLEAKDCFVRAQLKRNK